MGFFFENLIFLILLNPKWLFLLDMLKTNKTMAINKFQMTMTFALSAKVTHNVVPSIY